MKTLQQYLFIIVLIGLNINVFGQCVIPPADMVSWWTGDNNTLDIIGTNDGTPQNGLGYTTGIVDEAFSFDGVNDFIEVPHSNNLDLTGDITIGLWVKQTVFNPENMVLCKGAEDGNNAYSIRFSGQIFECVFKDNLGTDIILGGPAFEDFQWHHYAYVRQGNQHQIYADGFGFGIESFTNLPASSSGLPLTMGAQYNSQNSNYVNFFGGEMDEVSIYNRALTESEIQSIYNAGSEGKCVDDTNALGYLFWGNQTTQSLNYSNLDGSNETEVINQQTLIRRVRVNETENKVYWALPSESKIKKSNLNGSNVEDVITTTSGINVVSIDKINNAIYFVEGSDGIIKKCDLNGLNPQTVVSGVGYIQGITINNTLNKLYWTEFDTGLLKRANLDGTNIETLLTTTDALFDVVVDATNEFLYFSNRTGDTVERVDLDGGNRTVIVNASGTIGAISLDVINGKIYWTFNNSSGASGISVANTNGTNQNNLISSATAGFSGVDIAMDVTLSNDSYKEKLNVSIFPNPVIDIVTFEFDEQLINNHRDLKLSIMDVTGRVAFSDVNLNTVTNIDVSSLSKGMYLYTISNDTEILKSGKLIKK
ncbi:LamG-like jellyroll fold domain-containing protein [Winogradskyella sp.]|jgi:hypothetical protein|uniref:LamG-like jellyroll fold domain-containing protein n=1 Tax=Winogradskyella sp. TaxID=1883156 RepID=UPI0025E3C949|nr:LamG-like jellyroll fold domain-containing protein [Winogradskyella sp.]MCT4630401.1 T9SS type A sorting domain-containing protein [Winogradskyella sp.]